MQLRQKRERQYIREVIEQHASRTFIIPWQAEPPTGREGLNRLVANAAGLAKKRIGMYRQDGVSIDKSGVTTIPVHLGVQDSERRRK